MQTLLKKKKYIMQTTWCKKLKLKTTGTNLTSRQTARTNFVFTKKNDLKPSVKVGSGQVMF